jgi:hypothetical protein
VFIGRSQWPRGLRRGPKAARLLGSWFQIPPKACMSVSCECFILSGRGLCVELITHPEESYRLWLSKWVWSWNLDNEEAVAPWKKKKVFFVTFWAVLTAVDQLRSHASPCAICGAQSDTGACCALNTSVLLCQLSFHEYCIFMSNWEWTVDPLEIALPLWYGLVPT